MLWWFINQTDQTIRMSGADVVRHKPDIKLLKEKCIGDSKKDFYRGKFNTKLSIMFIKDLDNSIILNYGRNPMAQFERVVGNLIDNFGVVENNNGIDCIAINTRDWNLQKVLGLNKMTSPGEEIRYSLTNKGGLKIKFSLKYLKLLHGSIAQTNPFKYVTKPEIKTALADMLEKEVIKNPCSLQIIQEMGEAKDELYNESSSDIDVVATDPVTETVDEVAPVSNPVPKVIRGAGNQTKKAAKKELNDDALLDKYGVEPDPNDPLKEHGLKWMKIMYELGACNKDGIVINRDIHNQYRDEKKVEQDEILRSVGITYDEWVRDYITKPQENARKADMKKLEEAKAKWETQQ